MRHKLIDYIHYIEWMMTKGTKISIQEFQEAFPRKFKSLDAAYAVARRITMAIHGRATHSEQRNYRIFATIKKAAKVVGIKCPRGMIYGDAGESKYAKAGKRKTSVALGKSIEFKVNTFRNSFAAATFRDYLKDELGYQHDTERDLFFMVQSDKFVIARANSFYRKKYGNVAFRIICRVQRSDDLNLLLTAVNRCGMVPKDNNGKTIWEFDFEDNRSMDELHVACSTLNNSLEELKKGIYNG
jgi:hypothetical protein